MANTGEEGRNKNANFLTVVFLRCGGKWKWSHVCQSKNRGSKGTWYDTLWNLSHGPQEAGRNSCPPPGGAS